MTGAGTGAGTASSTLGAQTNASSSPQLGCGGGGDMSDGLPTKHSASTLDLTGASISQSRDDEGKPTESSSCPA